MTARARPPVCRVELELHGRGTRRLLWGLLALLLAACETELVVLSPHEEPPSDRDADSGAAKLDADVGELDTGLAVDAEVALDAGSEVPRELAAFEHTCAFDSRTLFCWGSGLDGQFGSDGGAGEPRPLALAEGSFRGVCSAEHHACALREDGTLLCWGGNDSGQLGLGDRMPRPTPSAVSAPRFVAVACGGDVTCAIAERGELYCWGSNAEGTLAQGDPQSLPDSLTPLRVARELHVAQVGVGQGHVCAIDDGDELYCWGRNTVGQLGVPGPIQIRTPQHVDSARSYESVAAAQDHTCAIAREGRMYCWGDNAEPLLGVASSSPRVDTPSAVSSSELFRQVAVSWFHSCAISQRGALYCWGRNREGQLGLGDMTTREVPTRVGLDEDWRRIAVGRFHTCGVRANGLYCWGDNRQGQLGLPDLARRYVPIAVPLR